jgi:RNA polymerase sigma factor (sigma-70 family)
MSESHTHDHFLVPILANPQHPHHDDVWQEWRIHVLRIVRAETRAWQSMTASDLEDLTQTILGEIASNLANFSYQSSFRTWVYSIAAKQVISFARSQSAQKRAAQTTPIDNLADVLQHPTSDQIEQSALIQELRRMYIARLQREPDARLAAILWLSEARDLHPDDIAQRIHLSASHTRALLQHAKKLIQTDLHMLAWLKAYRDQESNQ